MWAIMWVILLIIYTITIMLIIMARRIAYSKIFGLERIGRPLIYAYWTPLHKLPSDMEYSIRNPPPDMIRPFGYVKNMKGFLLFAGALLSIFYLLVFYPVMLVLLLNDKETQPLSIILLIVLQAFLCSFTIWISYNNFIILAIRERVLQETKGFNQKRN
jgi:hypothetical protein